MKAAQHLNALKWVGLKLAHGPACQVLRQVAWIIFWKDMLGGVMRIILVDRGQVVPFVAIITRDDQIASQCGSFFLKYRRFFGHLFSSHTSLHHIYDTPNYSLAPSISQFIHLLMLVG